LSGAAVCKTFDEEARFHIDELTDEYVRRGMAPADARRAAERRFGNVTVARERTHEADTLRWLSDAAQDVRFALRTLRKNPVFASVAVLTLAIGIGANTAIFTIVEALLIRRLPISSPEQVSYITRTGPSNDARGFAVNTRFSYPMLTRYQTALAGKSASLAGMSSVVRMQVNVNSGDDAELALAQLVTGDWFDVLDIRAQLGRVLAASDDEADGQAVAVLSDAFWTRRFARDPSILGATIRLNRYALTIVGIAAPRFDGFIVGDPVDLWVPSAVQSQIRYTFNADITDADIAKPWRPQDGISWLTIVARVPPPATAAGIGAVLDTVFRRDQAIHAAAVKNPEQRAYMLRTHVLLADGSRGVSDVRQQFGRAVLVLMATVSLVLLIACANLANLLMARSAARSHEFAVRLSLGAGRGRLARQLLTETLLLAGLGGAASVLLARVGSAALLRMASSGPSPLPLDASMTWPVVVFSIALSVASGVMFGLIPALRFSRPDVFAALKSAGRAGIGGSNRTGRMLVVAQVALSFALLAGATLFVRSLHNLLTIDPGFRASHLVTAKFDPRLAGYTPETMAALHERLLDGLRGIPGARSVALAMCGTMANCHSISDIAVPGRPPGVGDDSDVQNDFVTADYFPALVMTFVSGRNFSPADRERATPVAIVNEAMARHFYGDANVVGKHFKGDVDYEIVGVVRDSRINGLRSAPPRMAFYPFSQHLGMPVRNVYVRVDGDVAVARQMLRDAIRNADRGIAVREVVTLAELGERSIARERLVSDVTGTFGVLGLAVACLGLYGMLSYAVARRTNEIGIRVALGASRGHVRWLVLRDTIAVVTIGVAIGAAVTLPALRFVETLAYGISAQDPATFASAAAILAAVAVLAAAGPAWRASRVDPLVALRIE
jgi:predicted permease